MRVTVRPLPGCTMPPPFAPLSYLWAMHLWALRRADVI